MVYYKIALYQFRMTENFRSKRYVFPADPMCVEEEYLPSEGTYLEGHTVKAAIFGEPFLDRQRYKAKVFPKSHKIVRPVKGDLVIGIVKRVGKISLSIEIHFIGEKESFPPYTAVMHISNASQDFMEDMNEYFAVGDIVRAKVIDSKTIPLQLMTKSKSTGSIYSLCNLCGEPGKKIKRDTLICTGCEHKFTRKTAIDYGRGVLTE